MLFKKLAKIWLSMCVLPCFGIRWVCSFHSVHSQGGEDLAVSSLGSLASLDKVHEREAASKTHHKWTPNLLTQLLNLFSCLTSPPQSTTKNMSATLCNYVGLQCKRHLGRRAEMIIWSFTSTLKPTDYINRRRLKNQFETLQTFGIQNLLKNDVTSKGFVTQHFH